MFRDFSAPLIDRRSTVIGMTDTPEKCPRCGRPAEYVHVNLGSSLLGEGDEYVTQPRCPDPTCRAQRSLAEPF